MELFPDLSAQDLQSVLRREKSDVNNAVAYIVKETAEAEKSSAQSAAHD